jgi:hypothetical protein
MKTGWTNFLIVSMEDTTNVAVINRSDLKRLFFLVQSCREVAPGSRKHLYEVTEQKLQLLLWPEKGEGDE